MTDAKVQERLAAQRARELWRNVLLFGLALLFHATLFLLLPSFALPVNTPHPLLIELTRPAPPVAQATVEPTTAPGLPGGQNTSPVKGPDTAPGKLSPPPGKAGKPPASPAPKPASKPAAKPGTKPAPKVAPKVAPKPAPKAPAKKEGGAGTPDTGNSATDVVNPPKPVAPPVGPVAPTVAPKPKPKDPPAQPAGGGGGSAPVGPKPPPSGGAGDGGKNSGGGGKDTGGGGGKDSGGNAGGGAGSGGSGTGGSGTGGAGKNGDGTGGGGTGGGGGQGAPNVGPPSPPPPPPGPSDAELSLLADYGKAAAKRIKSQCRNSEQGARGTVRIEFDVDRKGRLLDVRVSESSGHNNLDNDSLEATRAAFNESYEIIPFPSDVGVKQWTFRLAIAYPLY